jgi:hypothetical protein
MSREKFIEDILRIVDDAVAEEREECAYLLDAAAEREERFTIPKGFRTSAAVGFRQVANKIRNRTSRRSG